jgi:hypothetical protein
MRKRLTPNQIGKIKQLANSGKSVKDIAITFGLSKSTIYYHARNNCYKISKFNVCLIDDNERGYVIGLFVGDGSFNRGRKEPRFFVRYALDANNDKDVALKISQILSKAGKRINLLSWKSNIIAKTCSKDLVMYIRSCIVYKDGKKFSAKSENWSKEFKYGFVAGIIDSDGHVHKHLGTEIKTVSPEIFDAVSEILKDLDISTNVAIRAAPKNSYSPKPRYTIYIPSLEMKRVKTLIPSVKLSRYP